MKNHPLVSVVIPALNSEKTIEKCLKSVQNQTYDNIEIIIVDGGSDDNTIEIASKYGTNVLKTGIASMTIQTNIGIDNSSGKYIYRVDSDVILPPDIVNKCVKKCEIEGYDGVCVFWLPDDTISFWAKVRKIEKENYIQKPNYVGAIKYSKNVLGARFLKKDVIDAIGGLEEKIPTLGEDYALYNKLAESQFQFAIIDSYERHIGEPKEIRDIIKKNFRYGTALNEFINSQGKGLKQWSPFGRSYLKNAFIETIKNNKVLFFGLIFYLFTVYSSTATGLLYYKFTGKIKNTAKIES